MIDSGGNIQIRLLSLRWRIRWRTDLGVVDGSAARNTRTVLYDGKISTIR